MSIPFLVSNFQTYAAFYSRPTSASNTGVIYFPTLDNAYNTPTAGASVDTLTSTGLADGTQTYTDFSPTGTTSLTLTVRGMWQWIAEGSVSGTTPATSIVQYQTTTGGAWTTFGTYTGTMAIYTVALSNVDLAQLSVRNVSSQTSGGNAKLGSDYLDVGVVNCSDIVVY